MWVTVSIAVGVRNGARGRYFNVVDLVKRLEAEGRAGRHGRMADILSRMDFIVLDELGYLPFAQSGGQLLFHLVSRLGHRVRGSLWRYYPQMLELADDLAAPWFLELLKSVPTPEKVK